MLSHNYHTELVNTRHLLLDNSSGSHTMENLMSAAYFNFASENKVVESSLMRFVYEKTNLVWRFLWVYLVGKARS